MGRRLLSLDRRSSLCPVADVLYQLKVLRQIRIDTLAQAMNNSALVKFLSLFLCFFCRAIIMTQLQIFHPTIQI